MPVNRLILQFSAWMEVVGYAANSLQSHQLDAKGFMDWLETESKSTPVELKTLKHGDLHRYCTHLSGRLKPRSVGRHVASLRLFFRFLQAHQLIKHNPALRLHAPALPPEPPQLLRDQQVRLLLDTPNLHNAKGLRDAALLELLYRCGLKLHELTALNQEDVLLSARALRVGGKKARLIPLSVETCELLKRYLGEARPQLIKEGEAAWLFPGIGGKRLERIGVWRLVKRYATKTGIASQLTPRTLRHASAAHLLADGVELDAIKRLFGYKRRESTAIYAHITPKHPRSSH